MEVNEEEPAGVPISGGMSASSVANDRPLTSCAGARLDISHQVTPAPADEEIEAAEENEVEADDSDGEETEVEVDEDEDEDENEDGDDDNGGGPGPAGPAPPPPAVPTASAAVAAPMGPSPVFGPPTRPGILKGESIRSSLATLPEQTC